MTPERLAYRKAEAAAAIGVSVRHFEREIQPELRVVRSGRLVLVPRSELERWLREHSRFTLELEAW